MNDRLRIARQEAGFPTATAALEKFRWKSSTYRAHENGQNNFDVHYAEIYAKAYGVSASYLLLGDVTSNDTASNKKNKKNNSNHIKSHKHNCIERIYAMALLLQEDEYNTSILNKLKECIESQINKTK